MKAYVGQTRSAELIKYLKKEGIGECTVRGELPPRRRPYFHDNGAYRDWELWKSGDKHQLAMAGIGIHPHGFDSVRWDRDMRWMRDRHLFEKYPLPDFVVVPDVVGDGEESLRMSREYLGDVPCILPVYLAVQDGMETMMQSVVRDMREYDGLFVGGTDEWKERTAGRWVGLAHINGLKCHIGRVGTARKVRWARSINADSIDSSFPLFHADHMGEFIAALNGD